MTRRLCVCISCWIPPSFVAPSLMYTSVSLHKQSTSTSWIHFIFLLVMKLQCPVLINITLSSGYLHPRWPRVAFSARRCSFKPQPRPSSQTIPTSSPQSLKVCGKYQKRGSLRLRMTVLWWSIPESFAPQVRKLLHNCQILYAFHSISWNCQSVNDRVKPIFGSVYIVSKPSTFPPDIILIAYLTDCNLWTSYLIWDNHSLKSFPFSKLFEIPD